MPFTCFGFVKLTPADFGGETGGLVAVGLVAGVADGVATAALATGGLVQPTATRGMRSRGR
jgi:hypothetical protein